MFKLTVTQLRIIILIANFAVTIFIGAHAGWRVFNKYPDPVSVETCFYTVTSDESFILERHGRVVVGSPCSGHGFKFAPLTGRRIASLAEEVL